MSSMSRDRPVLRAAVLAGLVSSFRGRARHRSAAGLGRAGEIRVHEHWPVSSAHPRRR